MASTCWKSLKICLQNGTTAVACVRMPGLPVTVESSIPCPNTFRLRSVVTEASVRGTSLVCHHILWGVFKVTDCNVCSSHTDPLPLPPFPFHTTVLRVSSRPAILPSSPSSTPSPSAHPLFSLSRAKIEHTYGKALIDLANSAKATVDTGYVGSLLYHVYQTPLCISGTGNHFGRDFGRAAPHYRLLTI